MSVSLLAFCRGRALPRPLPEQKATIMPTIYESRREKLLAAVDVDVVALVPGANFRYFTGLRGHISERPTIAFATHLGYAFLVPALELANYGEYESAGSVIVSWSDADGYREAFAEIVQRLGLHADTRLGVDGQTMRVFEWLAFEQAGVDMAAVADVGRALLNLRAIKTAEELDAMREAIRISEEALARTLEQIQPGMTELQITKILSDNMSDLGSEGHAFGPIVLTGENTYLPHGIPGERQYQPDDFLLIDFGAIKHGYPADITRTFCTGTPSEEMRKIHAIVLQANEAARALAKPGAISHEVDRAARQVIEDAGYGEYFRHRTGHGLGLEVHEQPDIAPNNETVLQEGMVFTIEPGIYLPGVGGVRIEDNVVITADGSESLTSYPRGMGK